MSPRLWPLAVGGGVGGGGGAKINDWGGGGRLHKFAVAKIPANNADIIHYCTVHICCTNIEFYAEFLQHRMTFKLILHCVVYK